MILYLCLGLIIGALAAYLWAHLSHAKRTTALNEQQKQTEAELNAVKMILARTEDSLREEKGRLIGIQSDNLRLSTELARLGEEKKAMNEKLIEQARNLEEMHQKLNVEFENLANRILETKSEKFVQVNKTNLQAILDPLDKKILEFQQLVQQTYSNESKERVRLETVIMEMQKANVKISEEANHLATALKGQAKTQGGWGEMILRRIFEQSGLTEGREYRLQDMLRDDEGNPLRSASEGKKMQPDAIVMYPDEREVIIDAKVSLNAFLRYNESDQLEEQKQFASEHTSAVRKHVMELSAKGYDDHKKSLDFVIMFVPNEAAFNLAMQTDPDLWSFAYEKKILLSSPLNLITSLKMFEDLWRRDDQSRNAMEIAELGSKLHDKFVGFVEHMEEVGKRLDNAKMAYEKAHSQLSTGRGNLINQAQKLVDLGAKAKKRLRATQEND